MCPARGGMLRVFTPVGAGDLREAVLRPGGGRVELRSHPVRAAVRLAAL